MEIDTITLLAYATIWTIFYFFLSNYIAELSRKKWTTWVQSEESDDILVEALQAVIEEIEDQCGTGGRVLSLKINGTF